MSKVTSHHELVNSEPHLLGLIEGQLNDQAYDELVLMSGHFMLFYDEVRKKLVPGIYQEHEGVLRERIEQRVGIFPEYTWDLSMSIAKQHIARSKKIKFLLLINDWQYVPDQGSASEFRAEFYNEFTKLPSTYL